MKEGKASTTAEFVAWARALATQGHGRIELDDRFAKELLPLPVRALLALTERERAAGHFAHLASLGLVEHIAMRSVAIDRAVMQGIASGADQLVVLGAGLDTRAHRLRLSQCDVFEVDHPATQTAKQKRAARLPLMARSLRYVPVDFAREVLVDKLRRAGYDKERRSVFIWEGVTMYLPIEAVRATLDSIASITPKGSVLAMTYFIDHDNAHDARFSKIGRIGLRALGEPILSTLSARSMPAELSRVGFVVASDEGDREWTSALGIEPVALDAFHGERLVVARRV